MNIGIGDGASSTFAAGGSVEIRPDIGGPALQLTPHTKPTAEVKPGTNELPPLKPAAVNGPPPEPEGIPGRN